MLRVLFVIDGLAGGGAERVVLTLADAMAAAGHAVTLVSLRHAQAYPVPPGIRFLEVTDGYRGPLRRWREISRRARQLDAALADLDDGRPWDLAFSVLPKTDRIVAASRRLTGAWFCLHGAVASTQLGRKRGWRAWVKRRQLRRTYDGRRWLVVSPALADDLTALTGARPAALAAIPNPFDLAAIRAQAAAPCPLDGERFLVHVGRFHPVKRHDRLFAAFRASGFPGRLVLVGDGTPAERGRLEELARQQGIAERIVWAGFLNNPFPYLRAAAALVLSSDSEGFGNVLVEALACGTPVVSTDCPFGPRGILVGDLARGLAPLTAEGLAAALTAVLAQPPVADPATLDRYRRDTVVAAYLALAGQGRP
jgi:glycosyltransferase involved in cell wall biosynthesis